MSVYILHIIFMPMDQIILLCLKQTPGILFSMREISFITSSANNVPRITSLLHKLCYHYSPLLLSLPHPSLDPGSTADPSFIIPDPSISINEAPVERPPEDTRYHLFPGPEDLYVDAELETTLRGLGFGYRAGFISSSLGMMVAEHGLGASSNPSIANAEGGGGSKGNLGVRGFLKSLREGEGEAWKAELMRLKGVGRKVADCVGLMSMDRVSRG